MSATSSAVHCVAVFACGVFTRLTDFGGHAFGQARRAAREPTCILGQSINRLALPEMYGSLANCCGRVGRGGRRKRPATSHSRSVDVNLLSVLASKCIFSNLMRTQCTHKLDFIGCRFLLLCCLENHLCARSSHTSRLSYSLAFGVH